MIVLYLHFLLFFFQYPIAYTAAFLYLICYYVKSALRERKTSSSQDIRAVTYLYLYVFTSSRCDIPQQRRKIICARGSSRKDTERIQNRSFVFWPCFTLSIKMTPVATREAKKEKNHSTYPYRAFASRKYSNDENAFTSYCIFALLIVRIMVHTPTLTMRYIVINVYSIGFFRRRSRVPPKIFWQYNKISPSKRTFLKNCRFCFEQ